MSGCENDHDIDLPNLLSRLYRWGDLVWEGVGGGSLGATDLKDG